MFGTGHNWDQDRDQDLDLDLNWEPRCSKRAPLLEETPWSPIKTTELEETRDFTFGQLRGHFTLSHRDELIWSVS